MVRHGTRHVGKYQPTLTAVQIAGAIARRGEHKSLPQPAALTLEREWPSTDLLHWLLGPAFSCTRLSEASGGIPHSCCEPHLRGPGLAWCARRRLHM